MRWAVALGAAFVLLSLAACAPPPSPSPSPTTSAAPSPSAPSNSSAPPAPLPVTLLPKGAVTAIVSELDAPWSVLRLDDGAVLLSQRDSGTILELLANGGTREVLAVPGVVAQGEGGLLGLAARTIDGVAWVYAYFTAESDNRIVRMRLAGAVGQLVLDAPELVLAGIPKAGNHNGGRLAFGPDGMLYATAGDAGNTSNAQSLDVLAGKILRMTTTGGVPADNPFGGSLIWSFGHRNPQGLAWDASGRLWASEFGQNSFDELNLIEPGGNYGWPIVEGTAGDPAFRDPIIAWTTEEASPSGIAILGDTLFMAALRGQRLWAVYPLSAVATGGPLTTTPLYLGEYGRLRDVTAGPDGTLWFLGNNTDGRGDPAAGDDRLWQVSLQPLGQ